jgi:hypothetical protein
MLKKIMIGFMLSFLCFVQLGCCNMQHVKNSRDVHVAYLNKKFNKGKGNLINQNFIFLQKYVMTKNQNDFTQICYKNKHSYEECNDPFIPINSASGYIVKSDRDDHLYALTAAHWCEEVTKEELYDSTELIFDEMPTVGYFANFMGGNYKIKRYIMDPINDLCLIQFKSKYSKYAKDVNIAKSEPNIGDKVSMISAPMWSYENELRQHYSGFTSGCDEYECGFTIPATYGSSGSAVINEKGEIISIISRAAISFNNYAIGAKPAEVKIFLERSYETLRRQ